MPSRSPALSSLAQAAGRIRAGEDALHAIREFLDQVNHLEDAQVEALIVARPMDTGDARADALLAAVAEHLAATLSLACPAWVDEPHRFLDRFWFVSDVPGFRAVALAQTPMALKRRGIFWPARSLVRV